MDALLIPFSLIWTGIVIAMFLPTMDFGPSGSPNLILIFFLLIGIYFSVGRFIHDAALRRRTSYALTDERALFLRGSKLTSLDLAHLPKLDTNVASFSFVQARGPGSRICGFVPPVNVNLRATRPPEMKSGRASEETGPNRNSSLCLPCTQTA